MKVAIDVKDRREGELVRQALADPSTRAFVNIMGALLPLTARERKRVLAFATDKLDEEDATRS